MQAGASKRQYMSPQEKSPVDEYFETKEAAKESRKQNELQVWQHWMNNGQQAAHLEPLLKAYEPVFAQKVRQWKPKMIPESVYNAELQKHAIKAFQSYDPTKGAALNTHVTNFLKKALRFGNLHANMGYLPEGQSAYIGAINKATDILQEELGRPPTPQEIHDHLQQDPDKDYRKLTPERITTIQTNMFRDIPMSRSGGVDAGYDYSSAAKPSAHAFEEQQIAVAQNILPQIFPNKPDLHELFHYTFGTNGYPKISSTGELAKKMGKSQPQISRMKTIMGATLKKHMGLDEDE